MPKLWRLTRAAEASLIDIARWTVGTYGLRQAAAYAARCTPHKKLVDRFRDRSLTGLAAHALERFRF